jgi:hypothetical protein
MGFNRGQEETPMIDAPLRCGRPMILLQEIKRAFAGPGYRDGTFSPRSGLWHVVSLRVQSMLQNAASELLPRDEPPRRTRQNVEKLINDQGAAFDPDVTAAMSSAYQAVLTELRLSDREDAGTLMVAKRVVEIAARGERDPRRLAEATLELLLR